MDLDKVFKGFFWLALTAQDSSVQKEATKQLKALIKRHGLERTDIDVLGGGQLGVNANPLALAKDFFDASGLDTGYKKPPKPWINTIQQLIIGVI